MPGIYSVYDRKAKSYISLFLADTDGLAMRMVSTAARDTTTSLYQYAEDFTLYLLGDFDVLSGLLTSCEPPQFVETVLNLKGSVANGASAISDEASVFGSSAGDDTAEFVSSS